MIKNVQGSTISCCKDCPNRTFNCHSTCQVYIDSREEWLKIRKEQKNNLNKTLRQSDFNKILYAGTKEWKRNHDGTWRRKRY